MVQRRTTTTEAGRPDPVDPTRGETPARTRRLRPSVEEQERRFRASVVLATFVAVTYLAWTVTGLGSAHTRVVVSDLVLCAAPGLATAACWEAHRLRGGRHTAWFWFTLACLIWSAGAVAWAVLELVLGRHTPFPSVADLAFVAFAVPVAIGLTRFPQAAGSGWSRWRSAIDVLVIGGCLLLASLVWVLGPALATAPSMFAGLAAVGFALAGVLVGAAVLTRVMVLPDFRQHVWVPLCAGLLVLTVTDGLYVVRLLTGVHEHGGVAEFGRLAGFTLVALAARAPDHDFGPPDRHPRSGPLGICQRLVPYGAMALAVVAMVAEPETMERNGNFLWLTLPLAGVIAVRQFVVVSDHTAIARDLAEAVGRRTAEVQHREQWWRDLVQNLSDVVVVIDVDGSVRYCSPSAGTSLGLWPQEVRRAVEMQTHVHPEDLEATLAAIKPVLAGRRRNGFVECRVERADGSWGWFEVTAVGQLTERALEGTVLTLHDVSERRHLTDRLAHEAYHDSLTGLPNRALLMERIEGALQRRTSERTALLLIDLDDFKVINDRHGHAAGDLVLEVIGRRLKNIVRTTDTVARLGGDEFALLMHGNADQVRATADRLIQQITRPVVTGGRRFLVRASVGIVFAAEDQCEDPHSLLSHADIALYEAKARDKGGMVLIDGDERDAAAKQVHLREQIAQPALDQFSVLYQPIVDLATGRMRGVESLLRWHHPDLGAVAPDDFIPMAEHGGSIQVLGWHVLSETCVQLARWKREAPHHRLAVGVNISSRQLDEPGFAERVLTLISEHDIDPEQIVLELTEQSLAVDFETAVSVVAELRAGGVSVAVDDYGTGYSSLRYLHRFDADVVKIDRSFIAVLEGSVHTQKIVRSVLDMAESLDLQSIAEGIETEAQLALVRELGCELGQGYLFCRPVPAAEISRLVAEGGTLTTPAPFGRGAAATTA